MTSVFYLNWVLSFSRGKGVDGEVVLDIWTFTRTYFLSQKEQVKENSQGSTKPASIKRKKAGFCLELI